MPEQVTTNWWKEERGERIFVDFNQANRDRTMAGAYSPRALPARDRVDAGRRGTSSTASIPTAFTVRTVPAAARRRSATRGRACSTTPGRIDTLLEWWERDLANGLGELPFPPDFPKMPGEPPRVQPSKKNAENWDAERRRAAS